MGACFARAENKAEFALLLTVETVPAFVASKMEGMSGAPVNPSTQLKAKEIDGGNLNYAFVVHDAEGGCVFVKQAPNFIKVLGSEAKLPRERMQLEVQAFKEWSEVLGGKAKTFLPQIYAFDEINMVFIMDFLHAYQLLQKCLFDGAVHRKIATGMGEVLGLMHAKTHSTKVSMQEQERLTKVYENRVLRDLQLEYVYSKCFREDERAQHLREDSAFMGEVDVLKALYGGKCKENLALCHGDLHAGSVMVCNETGGAKIIDPEFVVYGPPGLDVGCLISTYCMAYCFHSCQGKSEVCEGLVAAIQAIWDSYSEHMQKNCVAVESITLIGQDMVGFAGCEVCRTALGLAYERSLRLEDKDLKAKAEAAALGVGVACIKGRAEGLPALLAALQGFRAA
eukprot:CAMPEP_0171086712 /NCGR_PEP_ID=MMETSP0766_2-20121228/19712_1 /TAXON_ID=439317 /ORGANISM="Gambierdiscus australes, Strain CAWD 149" /LENGTH=395 /DNA_ID=CAMNT_0011544379 /DNA_START=6 /DNA_END=1193 /DNA_ORIENTATION=+